MALYEDSTYLSRIQHQEFDKLYRPGEKSSWSGIYRCEVCGHEAVHTADKPLPPQNHHVHKAWQGPIQWRLIVTDSAPPQ